MNTNFEVLSLTRPGIEPESIVLVADALSIQPQIGLKLSTFASGRYRHFLKLGQPFINNFVSVELSNRSPKLQQAASFY